MSAHFSLTRNISVHLTICSSGQYKSKYLRKRLSGIQRNLLHIKFQNMTHWLSKYIQQDEETFCQMRLYLTKSIHQCHVSYISVYMLTDYQIRFLNILLRWKECVKLAGRWTSSSLIEDSWIMEHRQEVLRISAIGKTFSGNNLIMQNHNRKH